MPVEKQMSPFRIGFCRLHRTPAWTDHFSFHLTKATNNNCVAMNRAMQCRNCCIDVHFSPVPFVIIIIVHKAMFPAVCGWLCVPYCVPSLSVAIDQDPQHSIVVCLHAMPIILPSTIRFFFFLYLSCMHNTQNATMLTFCAGYGATLRSLQIWSLSFADRSVWRFECLCKCKQPE